MVARTYAVALLGISGSVVEVEADISQGLPGFMIIGLPDAALSDSRDRVRSGATNAGCPLSRGKITVNLSPAALPKHGSTFDLAIAMAVLAADATVSAESVERFVHLGELSLDGRVRPMSGVLPAILAASKVGHRRFMVPAGNFREASLIPDLTIFPVASIRDAAIFHQGAFDSVPVEALENQQNSLGESELLELSDVVGNPDATEALVVAAAGGHHLFLLGPPGSGKTMLAARLPGILPDLELEEALEVTSIRSLSHAVSCEFLVTRPPFENPHHTATAAALIGGGSGHIKPGAAVRASHGVLFLDEAPEFASSVLDALRQPLESGHISIHRANAVAHFPGRFQLVLAANPCPCGQFDAGESRCTCTPHVRRRYLSRLSGPLLDRIDIQLSVRRVTAIELRLGASSERVTTAVARSRVLAARCLMANRYSSTPWKLNSQASGEWLRNGPLRLPRKVTSSLDRALERGGLTMRGYDRVLRVAWTLADLDGSECPQENHLGQALYLRKSLTA